MFKDETMDDMVKDPLRFFTGNRANWCWHCGEVVRPLKKCADCLTAVYCDKVCQTRDWKQENSHKPLCKKIQQQKLSENPKKKDPPTAEELTRYKKALDKELDDLCNNQDKVAELCNRLAAAALSRTTPKSSLNKDVWWGKISDKTRRNF